MERENNEWERREEELYPLWVAIRRRDIESVKREVKNGANVNYTHSQELNFSMPLFEAVAQGDFEIVKYLVEHGAKISGYIINIAAGFRRTEILKYLTREAKKTNPILYSEIITAITGLAENL